MTAKAQSDGLRYFEMAKEIILRHVDLEKYAVFLYGSRVDNPGSRKSEQLNRATTNVNVHVG